MNKRLVLAILIFLFVLGGLIFVVLSQKSITGDVINTVQNNTSTQSSSTLPQSPLNTQQPSTSGVSLTELSTHNSASNCWVAYKGKVYDLTSFLPKHPGGINRILPYCGSATEFEQAFGKKHGTSKVAMLGVVGKYKGELN